MKKKSHTEIVTSWSSDVNQSLATIGAALQFKFYGFIRKPSHPFSWEPNWNNATGKYNIRNLLCVTIACVSIGFWCTINDECCICSWSAIVAGALHDNLDDVASSLFPVSQRWGTLTIPLLSGAHVMTAGDTTASGVYEHMTSWWHCGVYQCMTSWRLAYIMTLNLGLIIQISRDRNVCDVCVLLWSEVERWHVCLAVLPQELKSSLGKTAKEIGKWVRHNGAS